MRVGIVTSWFERGAAYVSKQYHDSLAKKYKVFIYARGGETYAKGSKEWDFPYVTWAKKTYFQVNATPIVKSDFIKWIKYNNIDTILFNEQQWWPPVIWAKQLGVKVGSYIDYYTEETIPFFDIYDFLICNTKRHYSAFKWHSQCFYLPWGTNIDLFKPNTDSHRIDKKIVFFSSLGYNPGRKGVYSLIKAFSKIDYTEAKLLIHTQVGLDTYLKDMSDVVKKMTDLGALCIVNKTIPAPGLYHLADVYCYLSKLDGIGLTLLEALSCGLPAITPDNPPMNEFVRNNINGQLVKVSKLYSRCDGYYWPQCDVDSDDLFEKIKYYLDNRTNINDLKVMAREYALSNFNWLDREKELFEIFESAKIRPLSDLLHKLITKYEFSKINIKDLIVYPYKAFRR